MKLLLHTCCAPCLIYPLERLREKCFDVTGFFYNPNIHPFKEYNIRKQAVLDYSKSSGVVILYPDYEPKEYFRAVNMMEDGVERCPICWYERLEMTAQLAKKSGFTHFSTTLLASPYQDQDSLKKIGADIAGVQAVEFYYEDFRPGFKKAHDEARSTGMYCQNYCGCIYSEMERSKDKLRSKKEKAKVSP